MKNSLLQEYRVTVFDKSVDGILGIELRHVHTDFVISVFSCYLSPENSPWGREANSFFGHLLAQLYLQSHSDLLFIGGDFNARIGHEQDCIVNVDDVPTRTAIDKVKKGHGDEFIDFLKDGKVCVLNGRLCPERDNFTFVSNRGRSVVDYIIVPHDCLQMCHSFEVMTMSELMDNFHLYDYYRDSIFKESNNTIWFNVYFVKKF